MREQLKYFQSEVFELNEAILANRYHTEGVTIDGYVEHIREEKADDIAETVNNNTTTTSGRRTTTNYKVVEKKEEAAE